VTDLAIETSGLTKRFGERAVVDRIDLAVPEGSVFGFLGPNGSGKTTTVRMLLGLAFPSAGRARVLGRDVPGAAGSVLPEVGSLVEGPAFYPYLSGRRNLERFDAVGRDGTRPGRRARVEEALDRVGLGAAADKRFRAYSLGMRQRLALAATLVRPCRLLVLDEPTNGLDPQGTREVRHLIRKLAADGITVFLSSHLLAEVEQLCTHTAVMSAGRVVAQGTLAELRAAQRPTLRVETPDVPRTVELLARFEGLGVVTRGNGSADVVEAELFGAAPEDVTAALVHAGVRVRGLSCQQPSLEDTFVSLTGEGFDVTQ
jgi:ABC-2 type transport system ATP-binding protein